MIINNTIYKTACITALCLGYYCSMTQPSTKFHPASLKIATQKDSTLLIVRIFTNNSKITYLTNRLYFSSATINNKNKLQNQYDKTIKNRDEYMESLTNGFKEHFTACDVLFIPDTLFKEHLNGDPVTFTNINGDVVSPINLYNNIIYMLYEDDEYKILLHDSDGNAMKPPWPHKKFNLFPSISRVINKHNYLVSQIKWFDKKIKIAIHN